MKLCKLISRLQSEDPNREVPIGFCNPHSHRGDYSELAFTVDLGSSIGSLLSAAVYAIDRDFEGYKGGTYRMTLETECYLTESESRSGIEIDEALLNRILAHDLQVFNDANEIDCDRLHEASWGREYEKGAASMYKTYSESDLYDLIEGMIYELGSQKAVACKLGISTAYLNDYLSGRRAAGAKILVALELRRVISYESTMRKFS